MDSISVIIPTYNRATTLPRALDSVFRQSRAAGEIIVVDDGSTDGTQELLKNDYPDVKVIIQDNHGVSHARNRGIENSTSDWIALLDSDDEWHEDKLAKQCAVLDKNPEHVLIHTDEIWIRNGKRVNPMKKHAKHGGHIFQHCLPLCAISPSSSLIHKSIFNELGLFDESLPACEDYDMWLRICAHYPVCYIDETLITKYGGHEDQLSKKHWGMDRFRINSLAKILNKGILSETNEKAAINMLKQKLAIYLQGAKKHGSNENVKEFEKLASQY